MRYLALPLCVLAFIITSCYHEEYQIKMTPQGDTMVRQLTAYGQNDSTTQPVEPERLKPIEKVYSKRISNADEPKQVFVGEFRDRMPQDIGGYGAYKAFTTELGTAYIYVEQFRGSARPAERLDEMTKAIDKSADMLIGWLHAELGKEKGFEGLRAYIDKDLRAMLQDLKLYSYIHFAQLQTENIGEELEVRMAVRVMQADLADLQEIVGLAGRGLFSSDDNMPRILRHFQRVAARKMGLDANKPLPESLSFLDSAGKAKASMEKYFRTTPQWQEFEKEARKAVQEAATQASQASRSASGSAAQTAAVATSMVASALDEIPLDIFLLHQAKGLFPDSDDDGAPQNLGVHLGLPREPLKTNGQWDGDEKAVSWQFSLSGPNSIAWPRLAYASWVEPDDKSQTQRFGQVALDGDDLAGYVMTRQTMSKDQTARWLERLAELTPASFEQWKAKRADKGSKYGQYLREELSSFLDPPSSTQPTQPATAPQPTQPTTR